MWLPTSADERGGHRRGAPPGTTKESTVSIYTDPMAVSSEIDRRFELAGVDRHDRHHHDRHRHDLPPRPLGAHPLVAFVTGLVSRRSATSPGRSLHSAPVTGRPRHS